jgi:predicted ABC-type ATPase
MTDNPFKLTPEKNKAYFERRFKSELAAESKAVEQPIFVLVGGQPGAGKSKLTALIKNALDNNAIILDADLFRPKHPKYSQMVETAPLKVFDLAREDVNEWLRQAGDFAIANKRNVIMDGTLRDKDHTVRLAETYRQAGYKIELNIVATHERNSHTSIFERYEEGLASTRIGRFVEPDFHKAAYEALPKTIQHLEENKFVDKINICSRDNEILYENNLINGQWEKTPEAVIYLKNERNREPNLVEIQRLEKQRENTLFIMSMRKAPVEEIEQLKKQFQIYSIFGRGKKR